MTDEARDWSKVDDEELEDGLIDGDDGAIAEADRRQRAELDGLRRDLEATRAALDEARQRNEAGAAQVDRLLEDLARYARATFAARATATRYREALEAIRDFIYRYDESEAPLYFEGWAHSDSEYVHDKCVAALAGTARTDDAR